VAFTLVRLTGSLIKNQKLAYSPGVATFILFGLRSRRASIGGDKLGAKEKLAQKWCKNRTALFINYAKLPKSLRPALFKISSWN